MNRQSVHQIPAALQADDALGQLANMYGAAYLDRFSELNSENHWLMSGCLPRRLPTARAALNWTK